jgi:hypothetical protein
VPDRLVLATQLGPCDRQQIRNELHRTSSENNIWVNAHRMGRWRSTSLDKLNFVDSGIKMPQLKSFRSQSTSQLNRSMTRLHFTNHSLMLKTFFLVSNIGVRFRSARTDQTLSYVPWLAFFLFLGLIVLPCPRLHTVTFSIEFMQWETTLALYSRLPIKVFFPGIPGETHFSSCL